MCPLGILGSAFCPDSDERNRKLQKRNYELQEDNSRLRKDMIEAGLECGASILAKGQR
jgi:hypothetical protein